MPIQVEMTQYRHTGGTKNYHLFILARDLTTSPRGLVMSDMPAVVVRRYGKIGTTGQFKLTPHTSVKFARLDATGEHNRRDKHDYRAFDPIFNDVSEYETLVKLHPIFREIKNKGEAQPILDMLDFAVSADEYVQSFLTENVGQEVESWGSW